MDFDLEDSLALRYIPTYAIIGIQLPYCAHLFQKIFVDLCEHTKLVLQLATKYYDHHAAGIAFTIDS